MVKLLLASPFFLLLLFSAAAMDVRAQDGATVGGALNAAKIDSGQIDARKLDVTAGWSRASLTKKASNGAAYFTITNPTTQNDRLLRAESEVADVVQIHNMTFEKGVMQMGEVDGLNIPAGGKITLKPGGYHIMLMGLKEPLMAGAKFNVNLNFKKAGTKSVPVAVRAVKDKPQNNHNHH